MTILARIRSYEDLAAALKTERKRQGVSQTKLEQLLGWDWEYLWKLESLRKYPAGRLRDWLRGLGVELVLVRTEDMEKLQASKQTSFPSDPEAYAETRKKVAAKGGRFRFYNLTPTRRREIARLGGFGRRGK
jgi:transcriptional regulator with XRE-family HTH domain